MDNSILWIELVVGIIVSFTLLGIFIWGAKQGQFDDSKKMMNGLLNDSTEDLQDAIKKDEKIKAMKEKKAKQVEEENKQ
jgi:cbb3-type cytochrome oxidase maturation protein